MRVAMYSNVATDPVDTSCEAQKAGVSVLERLLQIDAVLRQSLRYAAQHLTLDDTSVPGSAHQQSEE